jgi:hypothetical protein
MLRHVDALLSDWVEYHIRMLEGSGIGFPKQSPIKTLMDYNMRVGARPAGAVVPFLPSTPDRVRRIDQVMRVLPPDLLEVARARYITRDRQGLSAAGFAKRVDRLHYVVHGALLMARGE